MQQIHYLQEAGIAVMEVAAAGESVRAGVPTSSFILVREIEGEMLDQLFAASSNDSQRQLLQDLGTLVGQLHRHGFFAPVRMKDVIRQSDGRLVLIDRETRNPRPSAFSNQRATRSLGKMLFRQSRDGLEWSVEELLIYVQAYHQTTTPRLTMGVEQLLQQCLKQKHKQSRQGTA